MQRPNVRGFFDPATATWSYVVWLEGHDDKRCAVIDSVLDYDPFACRTSTTSADCLISFVTSKNLEVQWILETHIHADHITAAPYIKEKLGGKTAISRHILPVLKTWEKYFQNNEDTPLDGSQFDYLFEDNEKFTIGPMEATIIHTPGHTPADTTYIIGDAVFVGDSMLMPDVGTGRCDFPGGSAEDSYDSSRKIFALPENYRMYVGHDYPPPSDRSAQCMTTIKEQKESNVRCNMKVEKQAFIDQRNADDVGKALPELLLPSIQVNLRAGAFGALTAGMQYIKLPINVFS